MALIKCPECGQEVSENATACPRCGNPRSFALKAMSRPVLTEKTNKTWKLIQLISGICFMAGLVILLSNQPQHNIWFPDTIAVVHANAAKIKYQAFGSGLSVMGLIGFIVGRLGAWWYHG